MLPNDPNSISTLVPQPDDNNAVPGNPAGAKEGFVSSVEKTQTAVEQSKPEILKPSEVKKQTAPVKPTGEQSNKPNQTVTQISTEKHVVDKLREKTKLHPVAPNADKLTTIADKEEEDFIDEVELAHEHQ